jgi:hypothetical protein
MKDFKDPCPMTCVSEFFRIYRELLLSVFQDLGFLLFRLVGTSEAWSFEVTIRDLPFKTQAALEKMEKMEKLKKIEINVILVGKL